MANGYYVDVGAGVKRTIYAPDFSGNFLTYNNLFWMNSQQAVEDKFYNNFDFGATFFVKNSAGATPLFAIGVRDVIDISQHIGETWVFDNGNELEFTSSGIQIYFSNRTHVWRYYPGSGEFCCTILSPHDMQAEWGWNVAGYYGYLAQYGTDSQGNYQVQAYNVCRNCLSAADLELFWHGLTPVVEPTDPYGGETTGGGGEGSHDDTTEQIDIPTAPTLSSADSKFITIYNPSLSQLNALANYMWSSSFDIALYKTLFANPMDCILGLSIVPVAVPNGGTSNVTVGNMPTAVSMTKAASQYVDVSCGSVTISEYWGGYLDYEPYTKIELYLPYIGTHSISADDVMGKTVAITYRVDILSGACAAYIKCGDSVLYQFIGQCASSIPITGNDWTNVINGVLSIAGSIGSMVATGGASAPMAVAGVASTAVNALKPNIEKSGSMSGTGGMLGIQTPYFIITRPRQAVPKDQNTFIGYPSFINVSLDSLGGYNEIESVHLENIPCTGEELVEIERILKEGVIFSGI